MSNFPYLTTFDTDTNGSIPYGWINDPYDEIDGLIGATYTSLDWKFVRSARGIKRDHTTGVDHMAVLENRYVAATQEFYTNLLMPCTDLSTLTRPALEFYFFNPVMDGGISLDVDVLSNDQWVTIAGPLKFQSETQWTYFLYDLSVFSGQVVKVRFRGIIQPLSSTNLDMGIDDLRIFDRPSINAGISRATPIGKIVDLQLTSQ